MFYRYGLSSVKTFAIVMTLAIVIAAVLIFLDEKNDDGVNTPTITGEVATTYVIGEDDFTMEFPEGMITLSEEQITSIFGSDYLYADNIVVSEDLSDIIIVYVYDKENLEKDYTAEEFFKEALGIQDEKIDLTEKEISGKTLYSYDIPYETEDGFKYVEQDMIYDTGDQFICIIFDSLESDRLNAEEIIK